MNAEARKIARSWHRLQSRADSCVAACHAIVDARNGGEAKEQERAPELAGEVLDASLPESFDVLAARINHGEPAIVFPREAAALAHIAR